MPRGCHMGATRKADSAGGSHGLNDHNTKTGQSVRGWFQRQWWQGRQGRQGWPARAAHQRERQSRAISAFAACSESFPVAAARAYGASRRLGVDTVKGEEGEAYGPAA